MFTADRDPITPFQFAHRMRSRSVSFSLSKELFRDLASTTSLSNQAGRCFLQVLSWNVKDSKMSAFERQCKWPTQASIYLNGHKLNTFLDTSTPTTLNAYRSSTPLRTAPYFVNGENILRITYHFNDVNYCICYDCPDDRLTFGMQVIRLYSPWKFHNLAIERAPSISECLILIQSLFFHNPLKDLAREPSLKVTFQDPTTRTLITIPARSTLCFHIQCFDLDTFLTTRFDINALHKIKCPVPGCDVHIAFPELMVCPWFATLRRDAAIWLRKQNIGRGLTKKSELSWNDIWADVNAKGNAKLQFSASKTSALA